jgi:hypothetical protein
LEFHSFNKYREQHASPERRREIFFLSGGAVIGSTFYRNVFLDKNKRFFKQPLPTKIILRRQCMKAIIWKK